MKYALKKVGVKALVAAESFRGVDYYSILNEVVPELTNQKPSDYLTSAEFPSLKNLIMISDDSKPYVASLGVSPSA